MAKFFVEMKETMVNTLVVEADSYEEAEQIVKNADNECYINLPDMYSTEYMTEYKNATPSERYSDVLAMIEETHAIKRFKQQCKRHGLNFAAKR